MFDLMDMWYVNWSRYSSTMAGQYLQLKKGLTSILDPFNLHSIALHLKSLSYQASYVEIIQIENR
jgi:hypothetical protein